MIHWKEGEYKMKCITQTELEYTRPTLESLDAVRFCLNRLYEDSVHYVTEEFVKGLTFEELIGTLLLCEDELIEFR
jgi:hypothetical protein